MQREFAAVPQDWSVGQTIDYLRETNELPKEFIANKDRNSCVVSGKTAITADVANRSSAGPKNPSL
jgi:Mg/Co/Ni transporter MgtE